MSTSYSPKNSQVFERQVEVQKLSIPFTITGSATAAAVAIAASEPSILYIKTEGVDQITPVLGTDTITYSVSPSDASGIFNVYMTLNEPVLQVISTRCKKYSDTIAYCTEPVVASGDADALSSEQNIALTIDSDVNLTSGTLVACLEVEYIVDES